MFPRFESLSQYERSECSEFVEMSCKTLLLVLDDEYFPFLLDWAQTENISEVILFLLEADALRFEHADSPRQPRLYRLVKTFFDIPHIPSDTASIHHLHSVYEDISSHRIPLKCFLSMACDVAWKSLIVKSQTLWQSKVWPSIRRSVVGDYRIELFNILTDDYNIKYYEKFVSRSAGDAGSLKCWKEVRHVLQTLQIFKANNAPQPTITPTRGRQGSVILRTASIGSTSSASESDASAYAMPYDALNILLDCLRQMHQYILRHHCNGPSDVCRLDLAALVETTNSIRNVEVLDLTYVSAVISSAEKIIRTIERETFQYLQQSYEAFLESNEFVEFVAEYRIQRSYQVQSYIQRVAFLEEVGKGRYFHWKDTGDVLYTSYKSSAPSSPLQQPTIIALHTSESVSADDSPEVLIPDTAAGKLFQAISEESIPNDKTLHRCCWLSGDISTENLSLRPHLAETSTIDALIDACCAIGWGSHWTDSVENTSPTSLCVSDDDDDGSTVFASSDQVLSALGSTF